MSDSDRLLRARRSAELAVADMPDGDLKLKAFESILNHLLSAGIQTSGATKLNARANKPRTNTGPRTEVASSDAGIVSGSTPARILELKREGFFNDARGIAEIRDELQTHGWMYDVTALSGPLMKLVRGRELRRRKVEDGNKTVFKYFLP